MEAENHSDNNRNTSIETVAIVDEVEVDLLQKPIASKPMIEAGPESIIEIETRFQVLRTKGPGVSHTSWPGPPKWPPISIQILLKCVTP